MTAQRNPLPVWNLSLPWPAIDSPEFDSAFASTIRSIIALVDRFDGLGIGAETAARADARSVELVLAEYNAVLDEVETIRSYIHGCVTTDTRDNVAQSRQSGFDAQALPLAQLGPRLTAWLGAFDASASAASSTLLREHDYFLRRCAVEAGHLMSQAEESLATELHLSGGGAWARLHGNVTSQLTVTAAITGAEPETLTMSEVRNLAFDPDRAIRRRAYAAELDAWAAAAVPLAAALNGVKGEANALNARRRWDSGVDLALFRNQIDRETLEAMMGAAEASFPVFRRYLRRKAQLLGGHRLAWSDLFAPVDNAGGDGQPGSKWTWDEGERFIVEHFSAFSPRMGDLARRAYRDRWIDAAPRPGKIDGAYCMALIGDESRILTNFSPSYYGVGTLAHELGHAYHNLNLAQRSALQRMSPSTLAETASTFCETVIRNAALAAVPPAEQLAILESSLQDSTQVVVDIACRFRFERTVFDARRERELSVDDLNAAMLQAQRETYGDGLDPAAMHPFMWAVKGHYYSVGEGFYNFPYMFGQLFSLGLYTRHLADPQAFLRGYDDLLSKTGMGDAETLAADFGIDLHSSEFWRSSLAIIEADIDRFETLTEPLIPS